MSQEKWTAIDSFFNDHLIDDDPIFQTILDKSIERGLPEIAISEAQGQFLHMLVKIQGARNVLEIGTLGGYSTVWMAKALPDDGKIITIEAFSKPMATARANFESFDRGDLIDLRFGHAEEILPQIHDGVLSGSLDLFDMIFIDADKVNYPLYFEWSLKLLRPGGLIIGDNVVRRGEVINPDSDDVNVPAVREFTKMVGEHPEIDAVTIQTVGEKGYDGFMLIRLKTDSELEP